MGHRRIYKLIMITTFKDCTFLEVGCIPNKMKGKLQNGTGNTYDKCIFLVEKGKPDILFRVPKQKLDERLLNVL